jgi:hypothetical protein
MSIRACKPRENKDYSPGRPVVQRRQNVGRGFGFVDNRPEALQLRRLQETINKQHPLAILQFKAGVESFQVQWKKHPDDEGKNAAHHIGFRAKFKHGGEFNASHAEFRQQVKTFYEVSNSEGASLGTEQNDMHDDGYSRTEDPEDYTGANSEIFSGADLAGFHEDSSQLEPTDDIYYEFTAQQQIVDLSDNDNVIAENKARREDIWGSHPRKYSILGDK